ncbi:MAG TPA: glycosyltransferase [Nitrococcus sp.]|nr:glycosyltransferase [Nitrococcus sp.]
MSTIVLPSAPSLATRLAGTGMLYARWLTAEVGARRGGALPLRRRGGSRSLLLLASSFPPDVTGGVYRPLSFVQHAVERGWRVTVLTRPVGGVVSAAGRHLEQQLPEGVSVIRVPLPLLPLSWKLAPQVDGFFDHALAVFETAARRLERPDLVLCTGPAFDMFIAGELITRRFHTQLVLDYRDEWNECPFHFVGKGRSGRLWERRCLARAAAVLFTTRSQLSHALSCFQELDETRGFVVPNGWEPGDTEPGAAAPAVTDVSGKFWLSFLGALSFWTLPGPFLNALAAAVKRYPALAEQLRLRFIGKKTPRALMQLDAFPHQQMLQLIEHVPRSQVPALIAGSGALLLPIDSRYERYLPGKLFDYLASDRPILVFGGRGEAGALVERLGAGVVVPEADGERLAQALLAIMHGDAKRWCGDVRREWAQEHTRRRSAEQALTVLDSVIGRTVE